MKIMKEVGYPWNTPEVDQKGACEPDIMDANVLPKCLCDNPFYVKQEIADFSDRFTNGIESKDGIAATTWKTFCEHWDTNWPAWAGSMEGLVDTKQKIEAKTAFFAKTKLMFRNFKEAMQGVYAEETPLVEEMLNNYGATCSLGDHKKRMLRIENKLEEMRKTGMGFGILGVRGLGDSGRRFGCKKFADLVKVPEKKDIYDLSHDKFCEELASKIKAINDKVNANGDQNAKVMVPIENVKPGDVGHCK